MRKYTVYFILFAWLVAGILTIIFFNGTGDAGDSVAHYLFPRYAGKHISLLFDLWAKPVFVLLAFPFAQFGFTGIKVFNLLVSAATLYLTFLTAREMQFKNAVIAVILILFAPLNYILTFSGLTEPLFGLFLVAGIFCSVKSRFNAASVIISFLPFVRSEGLLFIGIFAFYFILKKQWKPLILLATGHFIYSVAGFFIHRDFLWVFSKIPYAYLNSPYGHGRLLHFIDQMYYVTGLPVYILFWTGIIGFLAEFRKGWKAVKTEETILIVSGFVVYLLFHSLAWTLGLFNSMGLKRVLLGVMPLIALIALRGFNVITELTFIKDRIRKILQWLIVLYIMIFSFTSNPAAIHWKKDMMLATDQKAAMQVADFIKDRKLAGRTFYYAHPFLSAALDIDHFDPAKHGILTTDALKNLKNGDMVIWDQWFAVVESGISSGQLDNITGLERLGKFTAKDEEKEAVFALYQYHGNGD